MAVKNLLTSDAVLVQYSDSISLTLAYNASPYSIGAVLSHKLPNGVEASIAYFSRTLSSAERNYSQIDKEALAAVAAVKHFHDYVYGHFFQLITDHKPLLGLLAGDRQTSQIISPRMSRWSVFLAAYNYQLIYCPGKELSNANGLSHCPLPVAAQDPAPVTSALSTDEFKAPIMAADMAKFSCRHHMLVQVLDWVHRRWPQGHLPAEFLPYKARQHELSSCRAAYCGVVG